MKATSLRSLFRCATLLSFLVSGSLIAQIRMPQMPDQQGFQPIVGSANSYGSSIQYQAPIPTVQLGATASNIATRQRSLSYNSLSNSENQREVENVLADLRKASSSPSIANGPGTVSTENAFFRLSSCIFKHYCKIS